MKLTPRGSMCLGRRNTCRIAITSGCL